MNNEQYSRGMLYFLPLSQSAGLIYVPTDSKQLEQGKLFTNLVAILNKLPENNDFFLAGKTANA